MNLFNRSANLIVANQTTGLDLSDLRFKFQTHAADTESPNTIELRVYNPSRSTVNRVINEYDTVILQAGYKDGPFGVIFRGTIKQFHKGKERNVDSYLDILAADGDLTYNNGIVNTTAAAGTSSLDRINIIAQAAGVDIDPNASVFLTGGILPRGKVMFGMMRQYVRELCVTSSCKWTIDNGSLVVIPLKGYLPGDVIQINSATGMVGIPESTDNGITVTTLLNPLIKIGNRIQINNKDVTQTIIKEQFFPSYTSGPTLVADVTADGIYRVLVVEHSGDTRETTWNTDIICLSLDPSSGTVNG